MQGVKGLIILSAAVVAVALGACRREEAAPLKTRRRGSDCHGSGSLTSENFLGHNRRTTMKGAIVLAAAIVAVALGACRREEAAPLKLGADVPAVADVR